MNQPVYRASYHASFQVSIHLYTSRVKTQNCFPLANSLSCNPKKRKKNEKKKEKEKEKEKKEENRAQCQNHEHNFFPIHLQPKITVLMQNK